MRTRYLISCCKLHEEWVGTQIKILSLIDLINNDITIRELFQTRDMVKFHVKWRGNGFEHLPWNESILPSEGAKLDLLHRPDVYKYKEMLREELTISQ